MASRTSSFLRARGVSRPHRANRKLAELVEILRHGSADHLLHDTLLLW